MKLPAGALCALCYWLAATTSAFGQSQNETVFLAVNTGAPVRVNCLASLEALLNMVANGFEISGILISVVMLIRAITRDCNGATRCKALMVAMIPLVIGLSTPGVMNWFVATARDANLLSY